MSADTETLEAGMTVAYPISKTIEVEDTDVFVNLALNRNTLRTVTARWDSAVALPAGVNQTVTYSFTVAAMAVGATRKWRDCSAPRGTRCIHPH